MHGIVEIYNNVLFYLIKLKKFAETATRIKLINEKISGFI